MQPTDAAPHTPFRVTAQGYDRLHDWAPELYDGREPDGLSSTVDRERPLHRDLRPKSEKTEGDRLGYKRVDKAKR
jgi:hypothetical protein